jgi:hypothetical protein
MVIVKEASGELHSFDFGPVGGDVTGRLAGEGGLPLPFGGGDGDLATSASSPSLLALVEKSSSYAAEGGDEGLSMMKRGFSVDDLSAVTSAFENTSVASDDGAAAEEASTSGTPPTAASRRGERMRSTLRSISFKGGREFLRNRSGGAGAGGARTGRGVRTTTAGEIREGRLDELPEGHHFVGRTTLSLEDIRSFNASRDTTYSLHDNDCRHYLNALCAHACPEVMTRESKIKYGRGGVASHVAWQNTWGRLKAGRQLEALHLIPLQAITDLSNFGAISRIKSACSASVVFGVGMRALPLLCRPVLAPVGLLASTGSLLPGVVAAIPARRLITTTAGAVAGVSAEVPVVREALMVGNIALTGLTDVARGLVAGTSSVVTAGVGFFGSSASAASATAATTAAAASATCEASAAAAAAAGASMVAAGTSRGAAATTAINSIASASASASSSTAVYAAGSTAAAGTTAAAAAAVAAAHTQALAARSSLTVTKVAASASKVKAVAGRAARATQTIAYAMGAGLKKIAPYPRAGGSFSLGGKKRLSRRPSQTNLVVAAAVPPGALSTSVAKAPRLSLRSDAALEARAQRPRQFFSFRRRDRAAAAATGVTSRANSFG